MDSPETLGDEIDGDLLAELREARKRRLARIRADIESGEYDTEDVLNAALERMVRRIADEPTQEEDEEEQL